LANTNKGRRFYIAVTAPDGSTPSPQSSDLTQEQFEALNWQEVKNVGSIGESGTSTNVPTYDELGTEVTQKQKGISNAGDPTVECARNPTDKGQMAMRAAALTKLNYAYKTEDNDAPSGYTNSIYYNRGLVTGPTRPNGRNEDFILEVFTLGLNQKEVVVDPEALSVPVNTVLPSITGADLAQSTVLTANEGLWTNTPTGYAYQWQKDTDGNGTFADISGATAKTFTLAAGQAGDAVRVQVTASNAAGAGTEVSSLPVGLVGS
jgi:hypothetical protein